MPALKMYQKLEKRALEGKEIQVAVVGAGRMGTGLVSQISRMKGIRTASVVDIDLDKAFNAYQLAGWARKDIKVADDLPAINKAIDSGKPVVSQDGLLPCLANQIEVVIEATGVPNVGLQVAYESIMHGKHIIMLNIEADVLAGPILKKLADLAGVVYSFADGDEPGVLMGLYNWARTLGYEVVAAGKSVTAYAPVDKRANPENVAERAKSLGLAPKMFASFKDGTKSQVEMCSFANAAGLKPDVRGMHGIQAGLTDLPRIYRYKTQGGILTSYNVIDIVEPLYKEDGTIDYLRSVNPGVFLIITSDHPVLQKDLAHLLKVEGPNYVLYRPYHLCCIETPISAVQAVLYNEPTGAPLYEPTTELIALAKKRLEPGDRLDGGGGFAVYGRVEKAEIARSQNFLPCGLAEGSTRVKKHIEPDQALTYDDVELNEQDFSVRLRRMQESSLKI